MQQDSKQIIKGLPRRILLMLLDCGLIVLCYYLAILPQRATFEAKTYNADGTVAVKFGPDGQSESYRYDAAGRVANILDRNREHIKTFYYHIVSQEEK